MAEALRLRVPLEPVEGQVAADFTITSPADEPARVTLTVTGAAATALRLQPVFGGRLVFKPLPVVAIPADPTAPATAPIPGDLFLSLSPAGIRRLARSLPAVAYPLVLGYHDVSLTPEFFTGTVLAALRKPRGSGFVPVRAGGVALTTPSQLARAFAEGVIGVDLRSDHPTAAGAFPLAGEAAPPQVGRQVTLSLVARVSSHPYEPLPALETLTAAAVTALPDAVPLPLGYLLRTLTHSAAWAQLAAPDHAAHPFLTAFETAENTAGEGRWRRLRILRPGQGPGVAAALRAFDGVVARASDGAGGELWSQPVNRLGEMFVRRPDNEAFRLELHDASGPVPLSAGDGSPPAGHLDLVWAGAAPGLAPADTTVTADLDLSGDPLTMDPLVELRPGVRDRAGLTVDPKHRQLLAERELVAPLQGLLTGFGFPVTADGKYGRGTRSAVVKFQREAATSERLGWDGPVHPATVVAFAGPADGIADAGTLTEMRTWRDSDWRAANSDALWPATNGWSDLAHGTTFAGYYRMWVAANVDRFNTTECLCNWFPLLLLVEYAAAHGLRLRLRAWPGSASTTGGARRWDMDTVVTYDSHGGDFTTKSGYYDKVASRVTARMIGELNTTLAPAGDTAVGDLFIDHRNMHEFYWHAAVIVEVAGGTVTLQQGTTPKTTPRDYVTEKAEVPATAWGGGYRRWDFAQFDD